MKNWAITVTVPGHLSDESKDDLFTHVADAVHLWEPEDRPGWDADLVAGAAGSDEGLLVVTREGREVTFLRGQSWGVGGGGHLEIYESDEVLGCFAPGLWEYVAVIKVGADR